MASEGFHELPQDLTPFSAFFCLTPFSALFLPDRISFVDALRWLRTATPGTLLGPLVINPYRPYRVEPRVLKRRKKEYSLMTKPRDVLRKALLRKKVAA